MANSTGGPRRKHLHRLPEVWLEPPVYFVTVCTLERQSVLTTGALPKIVVDTLADAAGYEGWLVGRYVIMPDHLHFFCAPASAAEDLGRFVGRFKATSTRAVWGVGWKGALWQREFFDHLMRTAESYEAKWHYVRENPVRAGLCAQPDHWPHQGELSRML